MDSSLRKIALFAWIAASGWVLDFVLFSLCLFLGASVLIANPIGAVAGISYAYFRSVKNVFYFSGNFLFFRFLFYLAYNVLSVCLFSLLISVLTKTGVHPFIAKIITTPLSFVANYFSLGWILSRHLKRDRIL